jgi:DNA polymerase III sliding clamp (beta) subunit (PCNA family)
MVTMQTTVWLDQLKEVAKQALVVKKADPSGGRGLVGLQATAQWLELEASGGGVAIHASLPILPQRDVVVGGCAYRADELLPLLDTLDGPEVTLYCTERTVQEMVKNSTGVEIEVPRVVCSVTLLDAEHGGRATIEGDQASALEGQGMPAREPQAATVPLLLSELHDALDRCLLLAQHTTKHPQVEEMLLEFGNDEVTLVATDTVCLGIYQMEGKGSRPGIGRRLILTKRLATLAKLLPKGAAGSLVEVFVGDTSLHIENPSTDQGYCLTISLDVASGEDFPLWRRIATRPTEGYATYEVSPLALERELKRLGPLAKQAHNRVNLRVELVGMGRLVITASTGRTSASRSVDVTVTSDHAERDTPPDEICINAAFLLNYLRHARGSCSVRVCSGSSIDPVWLQEIGDPRYRFLVMPINN